jgi:hypothetical protein
MQSSKINDPGSSSPFAVDYNSLPIVSIVNTMGIHTPQEKLGLIHQWAVKSKMSVEQDHCLNLLELLQSSFLTNFPSKEDQKSQRYKDIQRECKNELVQRLSAIASGEKDLKFKVGLQETWIALMKPNPTINGYKQWAWADNNITIGNGENIVDDVSTALAVMCKVSKK